MIRTSIQSDLVSLTVRTVVCLFVCVTCCCCAHISCRVNKYLNNRYNIDISYKAIPCLPRSSIGSSTAGRLVVLAGMDQYHCLRGNEIIRQNWVKWSCFVSVLITPGTCSQGEPAEGKKSHKTQVWAGIKYTTWVLAAQYALTNKIEVYYDVRNILRVKLCMKFASAIFYMLHCLPLLVVKLGLILDSVNFCCLVLVANRD